MSGFRVFCVILLVYSNARKNPFLNTYQNVCSLAQSNQIPYFSSPEILGQDELYVASPSSPLPSLFKLRARD